TPADGRQAAARTHRWQSGRGRSDRARDVVGAELVARPPSPPSRRRRRLDRPLDPGPSVSSLNRRSGSSDAAIARIVQAGPKRFLDRAELTETETLADD